MKPWLPLLSLLVACAGDGDHDGSPAGIDCDDADDTVYPDAAEACDGKDSDCDGLADDDDPNAPRSTFWADLDGDGYGRAASPRDACEVPPDYVDNDEDCDDARATVYPGAVEACDGLDGDCDGVADSGLDTTPWYLDADGDGYGDPDDAIEGCEAPNGRVAEGTDCDDADDATYPGAEDACGGGDADCDGFDDACVREDEWSLDEADATLVGEGPGDLAGSAVATGDVDGDGVSDVLVVATGAGGRAGEAYLALGPFDGARDLSASDLAITGVSSSVPIRVATMGDLDGDGLPEIVLGAPGGAAAYVVSGAARGATTVDAWAARAGDADEAGTALAVGDLDGDGVGDLVVGAPGATVDAVSGVGRVSVVSGPITGGAELATAATHLVGSGADGRAGSVVYVGDLDGDGADDLLVGAPENDAIDVNAGAAWLFLGPLTGEGALADADVTITGALAGDGLGASVAGVGDVNGDGAADWMVGAPGEDTGGDGAGAAYLFLGPPVGGVTVADAWCTLLGEESDQAAGTVLAPLGDLNADGRADVAVGEVGDGDGKIWLLQGPFAGETVLSYAEGVLVGGSGDAAGTAVAGADDLDGDGLRDLVVGSPGADDGGSMAGLATIVRGWED